MSGNESTRRSFIRTSALAGTTVTLTPWLRRVAGQTANDRIGIALVGQGAMGTGHRHLLKRLRDQGRANIAIPHICDVYRKRLDLAATDVGAESKSMDYRRVIDDKNVDVVLIATPDHWHHKIAKEAMEAGKDVYCEKPMCHTIEQAKDLVATQARTGRCLQVGCQGTSDDLCNQIRAEITKGTIGPLVMIVASHSRNGTAGEWRNHGLHLPGGIEGVDMDAKPGPDLDWDMFLGSKWNLAPKRDWHPGRFFQFRCYWDYSGGVATDLFFHDMGRILKSTPLGFPERVTASGGIYVFNEKHKTPQGWPDDREVPDTTAMTIDYPGGPTVVLSATMCNDSNPDGEIRGHLATVVLLGKGRAEIRPQGINSRKDVIKLESTRPGNQETHWLNLLECMRNRTPDKCHAPVDLGYRATVAISMGVLAYRQEKVMKWDAAEEEAKPA